MAGNQVGGLWGGWTSAAKLTHRRVGWLRWNTAGTLAWRCLTGWIDVLVSIESSHDCSTKRSLFARARALGGQTGAQPAGGEVILRFACSATEPSGLGDSAGTPRMDGTEGSAKKPSRLEIKAH